MNRKFRARLSAGELMVGTILTLSSPEVGEIMSSCGFDWLFIDLEHGALDIRGAQSLMQAAQPNTPCAVRVPANDEVWIKKCLDLGAEGIIIPNVRSKEDVEHAVRLCKYPPAGERSVGIARANGYGLNFQKYVKTANDEIALIIQVEHIDAVENIGSIVDAAGIDSVFVGPYDLSGSMGKIGDLNAPDVREAINRIRDCSRNAHIPLGIFTTKSADVKPYIDDGYRLIAVGIDTMLISGVGREIVADLKV
ncbi:HpcH/HpaI aldolase/citrate lyase family protein [Chloroflexota bacterium]